MFLFTTVPFEDAAPRCDVTATVFSERTELTEWMQIDLFLWFITHSFVTSADVVILVKGCFASFVLWTTLTFADAPSPRLTFSRANGAAWLLLAGPCLCVELMKQ